MDRRLPLAVGLDTFAVVLFVAVGRREHERDETITGLIGTAAPFLIALALAWLVLRAWRRPVEIRTGFGIWAVVLAVGMVLRNVIFGDGTATSFVVVATLFLALFIVGWRIVMTVIVRRRERGAVTSSDLTGV